MGSQANPMLYYSCSFSLLTLSQLVRSQPWQDFFKRVWCVSSRVRRESTPRYASTGKIFLDTRVPVTQHYTIRKWERLFLLVKIAWGDRTNILVQIIWGHELVVWRWCLQNVHGVKLILQQDLGVSGSIFVGLQWCSADLHSFCSSMRKHDRLLWRSIRL